MTGVFKDFHLALRSLRKRPGFAIVAVLTLALGIGVNSALFSVFDAFVLKPLPLKEADTLVNFDGSDAEGRRLRLFSYLDYKDYQKQSTVLSDVIAWNRISVTLGEAPPDRHDDFTLAEGYEYLFGQIVSDNYFTMLGADMELGRGFGPSESQQSETNAVVVLSHGFWERRFQSDRTIVGKTITLHGVPFKVIGVTARSFGGTTPDVPSFWVPLTMRDDLIAGWGHGTWLSDRNTEVFALIGRLAPGVSRQQAETTLQLTATQLAQAYPGEGRKTRIKLGAAGTFVTLDEDTIPLITPLTLGFGLVLLISCANVANLLLARSAGRQRDISIRLALGAGRWRVVRQLIAESLVLAITGGVAGLILATWTLSTLYPIVLSAFPIPVDVASGFTLNLSPDWRIFTFTLALATLAGIAAGLVPALQSSKPQLVESLKDEGATFAGRLSKSRLRSALVIAQIAICFALLVSAGLLVQNAMRLQTADKGMVTRNVFAVTSAMTEKTATPGLASEVRRDLAERIGKLPGVLNVSQVYRQPLSGQIGNTLVSLPGQEGQQLIETRFNFVSAEFFETMSLPIVRGRSFTSEELKAKVPVVVVSEATAKLFWPGVDAIGKRIGIADTSENVDSDNKDAEKRNYQPYDVVGIARDTRSRWVWQKDDKLVYLPLQPTGSVGQTLLVRTQNDPGALMGQVRSLASTIHPKLRVSVKTIDENLAYQTAPFRAVAWLSGSLGLLALLLCSVGLYGVVSFMVASRTREIGIRVALGAKPTDVVKMFALEGLKLTGTGMIFGLLLGLIIARLLSSILIDLSSINPIAYGSVAGFLLLISLCATLIPARRATRVDPIEALRYE